MSFNEKKITTKDIEDYGIQAVEGYYTVNTPEENKKLFDRLITVIVKEKLNALIDELQKKLSPSAADQIGCAGIVGIYDGDPATVREMLIGLKNQLDGISKGFVADRTVTEIKLTLGAVMLSVLTDYIIASVGVPSDLADTDTVAEAFGKLQRRISNILAGVEIADTAKNFAEGGDIESALAGKMNNRSFDDTPTAESTNLMDSDSLKKAFDKKIDKNTVGTITGGVKTGDVMAGNIAEKTITNDNIVDKTIQNGKIADKTVTNGKIADSTIESGKIKDNNVTNAKLAQMPTKTLKGNKTGSTANASDLSVSDVREMLDIPSAVPRASNTVDGTIRIAVSGNTLYISTDGNNAIR